MQNTKKLLQKISQARQELMPMAAGNYENTIRDAIDHLQMAEDDIACIITDQNT